MGSAPRRSFAADRLAKAALRPPKIARRRRPATFAAAGALSGRATVAPWHRLRLDPDFGEERDLWERGFRLIAGVDEVGRGCLAGPVVVGAVILPLGWKPHGLRDSKMLKPEDRERLAEEIVGTAVSWSVAAVEPAVIDRINILQATLLAVGLASARLPVRPDALLLDGTLHRTDITVHQRVVIDGDRLCASIAAASIVAKVFRDRLMVDLDSRYPGYDLASNKGYAAPEHRAGLRALGTAPVHRLSFSSCADVEQTTRWEAVGPGLAPDVAGEPEGLDPQDDLEAVGALEADDRAGPLDKGRVSRR